MIKRILLCESVKDKKFVLRYHLLTWGSIRPGASDLGSKGYDQLPREEQSTYVVRDA